MKIRSIIDDKKKQRVRDAIARGDNSVFRTKKKGEAEEGKAMLMGRPSFEEARTLTAPIRPKPAPPPVQQPAPQPPVQQPAPPHPLFLGTPWINQPLPPQLPQPQPAQKVSNLVQNIELHKAVLRSDLPKVKAALANGADVDVKNEVGDTPLMVASQMGFLEIAKELIRQKANQNAENPSTQRSALMYAAMYGHEGMVGLLKNQVSAHAKDHLQMTALFLAATKAKYRVVRMLSQYNDLDVRNNEDITPLMYVAKYNDLDTAIVLMDCGAHIQACNKKSQDALSLAVEYGSLEVAALLLERGAKEGYSHSDYQDLIKNAKGSDIKKLLKKYS